MKLSVNWLRELVEFPADLEEVLSRLTLLGLEVEEVEDFRIAFPKVIVGEVIEATAHPDADKLRVCRVHTGSEELQIVCGAPNVRAGLRVALATVGAVLPGDFRIKKSKIRGQVSMGMICSERELELGSGHDGILELDDSFEVGRPLDDYFGYADTVFEIEVTPNRPDWLSHIGVARELAAWYRSEVRLPDAGPEAALVESDESWTVRVEDPSACPRFTAQLMDGVKVGESPRWMRQRLMAIGQRPINAVVDASNYLLHECGHPNHCFDRDKLEGQELIIRRARAGESFVTLDGTARELQASHLLVADRSGGVALAGIMGGANSEVDSSSSRLLLEVAHFDPLVIRKGRRSVGLSTDASYRFERGVDGHNIPWVSRRLATLIEAVAGGSTRRQIIDSHPSASSTRSTFFVRSSQVRRLLGVEMTPDTMADHLRRLGIDSELESRDGSEGIVVTPPSFRHDLHAEVDAIEELGRMHGFDHFDPAARLPLITNARRSPKEVLVSKWRRTLAGRGYHECVSSSFQRAGDAAALGHAEEPAVRVLNPVVQGDDALRTSAVPEMVRAVARNLRHGWTSPIRLFECAKLFHPVPGEDLPREAEVLQIAWSGPVHSAHPDDPPRPVELLDVYGEIDSLGQHFGWSVERAAGEGRPWLRAGSQTDLQVDGTPVGVVGELSPATARALGLQVPMIVATFEIEALLSVGSEVVHVRPLSAFPPARRDLSLVVPDGVSWAQLRAGIEATMGELLESLELFDIYEGEGLPPKTRALGVRLALRSAKSTMKDQRVDRLVAKLLDELRTAHAIQLR